jgi:hypothetical protein
MPIASIPFDQTVTLSISYIQDRKGRVRTGEGSSSRHEGVCSDYEVV